MHRRRRLLVVAGLLAPSAVIGCSLVYPYGDIKDTTQEGPEGSSGSSDDATTGPDQNAGDDHMDLPEVSPDASAPKADVEAGPMLAQAGAVVVSGVGTGTDGGLQYVLSVLDPTSGKELSREQLPVVGVVYDGTRDLWYLFETLNPGPVFTLGPYPPAPGDGVLLHVRQLDTNSGAWTELAKVPVPTITSADTIAPLTNRLAYVAYVPGDASPSSYELVGVDTTNPAAPSADPASDTSATITPLAFNPSGVTGTRPSLTGAQGGVVTLMQNTSLGGGGNFQFITAKIGASTATLGASPVVVGPSPSMFSTIGVGSYLTVGPTNVFALPQSADGGAQLVKYDPSTGNKVVGNPVTFGATSPRFRPLAISECHAMVFVGQVIADTNLYAVPLAAAGTPTSFDVMNTVSNVRFEPYTNSAIVAFNGGAGYELTALTLGGADLAPALSLRTSATNKVPWAPPSDLRPTLLEVRQPVLFTCPGP
jgi:hypothetical protein